MKKLFAALTFLVLLFPVHSFAQNFEWVKQWAGVKSESIFNIKTDASGNIYISGQFRDTLDFDPGAGVFTMISDSSNIFVEKLSSSGNFMWAKK